MRFHVLESGSRGNATILLSDTGCLLIDMGLSKKAFEEKLKALYLSIDAIDGALFTHSHSDHIKGIEAVPREKRYATRDTYDIDEKNCLEPYHTYTIGPFTIQVFPTSHDAKGSIGFRISDQEESLVYMTDTGFVYDRALRALQNATYYIFESNHNVKMLLDTKRPQLLKDRILGDHGHLSNEDCAIYLSEMIGPSTKEIVLAHLSEEANTPEVATSTFFRIMEKRGISLENVLLRCASQTATLSGGCIKVKS